MCPKTPSNRVESRKDRNLSFLSFGLNIEILKIWYSSKSSNIYVETENDFQLGYNPIMNVWSFTNLLNYINSHIEADETIPL